MKVIDFSLAVAGPFGAQLLAELGAEVIKVCSISRPLLTGHMHSLCERSKRSIALNLKDPAGIEVFRRLVEEADVVHTNIREAAVARLGLDYEALQLINPSIIYCHTRGHEDGPRKNLTGHDQSAASIAGVEWAEGGMDDGGKPHWPSISIGDTGNGFLWAAAVIQALYHRDRTGEGQKVDTAIVNAHLLNVSSAWSTVDGSASGQRPKLDGMAMGWSALYRLYGGADGWLCLAVLTEPEWRNLCAAVPELALDPRFATTGGRKQHDSELIGVLSEAFAGTPVIDLQARLDAAGVPCEVTDADFMIRFFDDPANHRRGWLTDFNDPLGGPSTSAGVLVELSATPGKIWGPPFVVGDSTRAILTELGYEEDHVDKLCAAGVVFASGER